MSATQQSLVWCHYYYGRAFLDIDTGSREDTAPYIWAL